MTDIKACTCGQSPTGQCMGWHEYDYDQLVSAERQWLAQNPNSQWVPPRYALSVAVEDPSATREE